MLSLFLMVSEQCHGGEDRFPFPLGPLSGTGSGRGAFTFLRRTSARVAGGGCEAVSVGNGASFRDHEDATDGTGARRIPDLPLRKRDVGKHAFDALARRHDRSFGDGFDDLQRQNRRFAQLNSSGLAEARCSTVNRIRCFLRRK